MTSSRDAHESSMSIGQVLAHLAEEFPTLSQSKIRFLEEKGLIRPARTAAGYRSYSGEDVIRLRTALRLQRDRFLPLEVIAEYLDAVDRGVQPPELPEGVPSASAIPAGPDVELPVRRRARLRRSELVEAAQVAHAVVTQLENFSIVTPDKQGYFGVEDVDIVRTAAALADVGLEPRHLRAFRVAADREAGLVEQMVSPLLQQSTRRGHTEEDVARAQEQARALATLCLRLHTGLYRTALTAADLP